MALIRNLFAGVGCLTVLVVLLIVGWIYREDIEAWLLSRNEIVMSEPSPELATVVEEKLEALVDGSDSGEVRFTEVELQSYLQYRLATGLPEGVSNPALDVRDSTLAVSAQLDFRKLSASASAAEGLRRFLGDSARVLTELYPAVSGVGEGSITVLSLQAGVVPVPPLMIPRVLQQVGLETDGGSTVILMIPEDVRAIRVEDEAVVVVRGG